ncbi:MAG: hypothetical protein PHW62_00525 [Candidatus Ratteibacteria bacterium]|nr:hypothetical protein [Candidatus Ratteibacteria bacterium]
MQRQTPALTNLLGVLIGYLLLIAVFITLVGFIGHEINLLKIDYSNTEADVKVLEVGTHYWFLNIGEQKYIRIQNAFSNQFSTSSEVWETTISPQDYQWFKDAQAGGKIVHIKVSGYGITTSLTSLTGDRVVSKTIKATTP